MNSAEGFRSSLCFKIHSWVCSTLTINSTSLTTFPDLSLAPVLATWLSLVWNGSNRGAVYSCARPEPLKFPAKTTAPHLCFSPSPLKRILLIMFLVACPVKFSLIIPVKYCGIYTLKVLYIYLADDPTGRNWPVLFFTWKCLAFCWLHLRFFSVCIFRIWVSLVRSTFVVHSFLPFRWWCKHTALLLKVVPLCWWAGNDEGLMKYFQVKDAVQLMRGTCVWWCTLPTPLFLIAPLKAAISVREA